MRRLLSAALVAGSLTFIGFAPAHAAGVLTITATSPTAPITTVTPTATVSVQTDQVGTVAVDYHLDPDGGAPSSTILHATATTDATGAFTFDVTAAGLPDGAYWINGDVTVTNATDTWTTTFGPPEATYPPGVSVDRTGPVVTSADPYLPMIRPESTTDANTWMNITAYGDAHSGDEFVLYSPAGKRMGALYTQVSLGDHWYTEWAGQGPNGLLPAGHYTIRLADELGNLSTTVFHVRLERLASKTFSKTITAKASKILQRPGACSSVTSPSTHGWAGSISLNSNVRCHRTAAAGVVVTAHMVKAPAAVSYGTVQVKAYSGAARRAAGSRAQLSYLKGLSGTITKPVVLGSTIGTHAGPRVAASTILAKDSTGSYLVWYVATGGGARYDVKSFTVRITYRAWV